MRTARYALALLLAPALARAQAGPTSPACPAGTQRQVVVQDACQKAVDIFNYMAPQLGGALGSNPITAMGNFLPLTFSVGAVQGYLPQFDGVTVSSNGAQSTEFNAKRTPIPIPALTGNLTLWNGFQTPIGRVGGLAATGTVTFVPDVNISSFSITAHDRNFDFGYGGQVRLLEENGWFPDISVAGVTRKTPSILLVGTTSQGDTLQADSLRVRTRTLRFEIGKHPFWELGLLAGARLDHMESNAIVSGSVMVPSGVPLIGGTSQRADPVYLSQSVDRRSIYGGATLGILQVVVGRQSGGSFQPTYNSFSEFATDSTGARTGTRTPRPIDQTYNFASASLRFNF